MDLGLSLAFIFLTISIELHIYRYTRIISPDRIRYPDAPANLINPPPILVEERNEKRV
jgi:hypothetical protein